ncbi:MAG: ester cyclase [Chloroflexi bacterium]|nr:ester cyclase [Chloroflexota bacterium]
MAQDVRTWISAFYTTLESGDLNSLDQWVSPNFVDYSQPQGSLGGLEGFRHYFTSLRGAFPDLRLTVEDVLVDGSKVAVRVTGRGTQTGEYMGIQPTGRRVVVPFIDIMRVETDRIVEHWGAQDLFGLMRDLGMLSLPGKAQAA